MRLTFQRLGIVACFALLTGCNHPKTVHLFNGKDLSGWEVHTVEAGKENPGIFTVEGGQLKIAGGSGDTAYFGGIATEGRYSDYKLVVEFKFGVPTYGSRHGRSRDSGVLVHCIGPFDPKQPWLTSYEAQIIEGGVGDILIVNIPGTLYDKDDAGNPIALALTAEAEQIGPTEYLYKPGAPEVSFTGGIKRVNWWGRDPAWKDDIGYRGPNDVESPLGEWTRMEVTCAGDTLTYRVNGKVVNKARGLNVTSGRILIQTEGAEVWFRKIDLTPLKPEG